MYDINLVNFKTVLKKATLNNSIESVQIIFEDNLIKSKMLSTNKDVITQLKLDNDVIGINDAVFNFSEPYQQLIPFLDLIEDDVAKVTINNEKITIISDRQKINLHFCKETAVSTFSGGAENDAGTFLKMKVNENFLTSYDKIKRVGARFKKIYFNVESNVFSIETTDKTNMFSNGLKFNLTKIPDEIEDLTMCFDFKNFINFMQVIQLDIEKFELRFKYIQEQEMGMMYAVHDDGSEKYYITSRKL